VLHYFGSKEGVFRAALDFPVDPAEFIPRLLAPGLDGLGERLVHFFIDTWDSPAGSPLLGLIRSVVGNENAAAMLRDFVSREVVGRLAEALERDQPQVRASLVASQLVGLAMLRYVIKLEPLASASSKQIATWVGPAIQRYLTDPSVTKPEPRG
jgi:AcrR family transcriptional regulator